MVDLRRLLVPIACVAAAGLVGLFLAPTTAPWLWASLVGLAQGGAFAVALVLLVRMAATPHASGGLSAMGFLIGYGVASFGPVVMGAVRDATGGFRLVWLGLALLMTVQLAVSLALRPGLAKVAAPTGSEPSP